ncbi:hypothetical protein PROFUN_04161 [Planoprotostelium fungivorum]|uniref:NAC domain-containing protein n=1 Tax=Planoprotostelium fungivorum TaxID=1890364 RepID=A0A2P6NVU8_9EUKA|nr:hypothetical protein PROFUN_04161 [Planoprotostelium fungivorum]
MNKEDDGQTDITAAAETLGSLDPSRQLSAPFTTEGLLPVVNDGKLHHPHNMCEAGEVPESEVLLDPNQQHQQGAEMGHGHHATLPYAEWNQKEWNEFIQDCLLFLNETNPSDMRLFHTDKQILPETFDQQGGVFCYPFRGAFLPSGHSDGRVWKPSQGPKHTGSWMMKRYFYHKDATSGIRTKRQVTWLVGRESWFFIEYRNSAAKGKVKLNERFPSESSEVKLDEIMNLPTGIDWPFLLHSVVQYCAMRNGSNVVPVSASAFVNSITSQLSTPTAQNPSTPNAPVSASYETAVLTTTTAPNSVLGRRNKRGDGQGPVDGTYEALKKARNILREYGQNSGDTSSEQNDDKGNFHQMVSGTPTQSSTELLSVGGTRAQLSDSSQMEHQQGNNHTTEEYSSFNAIPSILTRRELLAKGVVFAPKNGSLTRRSLADLFVDINSF